MAIFYLLDINTDIYLEPSELPGMSEGTFAAADTDQDGRLSGFEFNQASFSQFEMADFNRDGTVTSGSLSGSARILPARDDFLYSAARRRIGIANCRS